MYEELKPSETITRLSFVEDSGKNSLIASLLFVQDKLKGLIISKGETEFVELSTNQCFFLLTNLLKFEREINQRLARVTRQSQQKKQNRINKENNINPIPELKDTQEKLELLPSDDCQNISLNMANGKSYPFLSP
jgi:hypothetical protein